MSLVNRSLDGYLGDESRDLWRNVLPGTPPVERSVRDPYTGRYTRTPPARLPELHIPETYRSTEDLRGKHFELVPPLKPAPAFVSYPGNNPDECEITENGSDQGTHGDNEDFMEIITDPENEELEDTEVEVLSLTHDVTTETPDHNHEHATHLEQREIQSASRRRLLDAACLDQLLAAMTVAADLPRSDEQMAAMRLSEDAMLTILLEQLLVFHSQQSLTSGNEPIRRHHERSFTEVALDVLTEELSATLDEDMADFDDYEQGLWNPQKEKPPDWSLCPV